MKKLVLLLLLFSFRSLDAHDDYISYYHNVDAAKRCEKENKPDSALSYYQKAFTLVSYCHDADLFHASRLAKKLKRKELKKNYDQQISAHRKGINKTYRRIIDSLSKEDQRVRSGKYVNAASYYFQCMKDSTNNLNSKEFHNAERLYKEWGKVDSSNVALLLVLIKQYGFPSEKRVGALSEFNAYIILLHFDSDTNNAILAPILDSALFHGDILPRNYAYLVDRRLNWDMHKDPYYFELPAGLNKLSGPEIDEVNKRRYAIGLPGVYEGREVEFIGNGWKVSYD